MPFRRISLLFFCLVNICKYTLLAECLTHVQEFDMKITHNLLAAVLQYCASLYLLNEREYKFQKNIMDKLVVLAILY